MPRLNDTDALRSKAYGGMYRSNSNGPGPGALERIYPTQSNPGHFSRSCSPDGQGPLGKAIDMMTYKVRGKVAPK